MNYPKKPIRIYSKADLAKEMKRAEALFKQAETDQTWEAFDRALQNIALWAEQDRVHEYAGFVDHMKALQRPIIRAMTTDRTRLSGTAIDLLKKLSSAMEGDYEKIHDLFAPTLLRLFARTNKVTNMRSLECYKAVIENSKIPKSIPRLCDSLLRKDPNKSVRKCVNECLAKLLQVNAPRDVQRYAKNIESALMTAAVDPAAEVRNAARLFYASFCEKLPQRSATFNAKLPADVRKSLAATPNPAKGSTAHANTTAAKAVKPNTHVTAGPKPTTAPISERSRNHPANKENIPSTSAETLHPESEPTSSVSHSRATNDEQTPAYPTSSPLLTNAVTTGDVQPPTSVVHSSQESKDADTATTGSSPDTTETGISTAIDIPFVPSPACDSQNELASNLHTSLSTETENKLPFGSPVFQATASQEMNEFIPSTAVIGGIDKATDTDSPVQKGTKRSDDAISQNDEENRKRQKITDTNDGERSEHSQQCERSEHSEKSEPSQVIEKSSDKVDERPYKYFHRRTYRIGRCTTNTITGETTTRPPQILKRAAGERPKYRFTSITPKRLNGRIRKPVTLANCGPPQRIQRKLKADPTPTSASATAKPPLRRK